MPYILSYRYMDTLGPSPIEWIDEQDSRGPGFINSGLIINPSSHAL
jgi:hypothetical protein